MIPLLLLVAASVAFGTFLILRPDTAIEVQRQFYEMINWKLEPVSIEKELRNTRIMGGFLMAVAWAALVYYIIGFIGR